MKVAEDSFIACVKKYQLLYFQLENYESAYVTDSQDQCFNASIFLLEHLISDSTFYLRQSFYSNYYDEKAVKTTYFKGALSGLTQFLATKAL